MSLRTAQILFPVNVPGAFDYAVPEGLHVERGDFVFAPIGKQMKLGVVTGLGVPDSERDLREIAEVKPTRPLPEPTLEFIDWVARYNVASPGQVLRMVERFPRSQD
ncbi:MAG: primosomal protein N', partial [Pseudomonadota bacterium]